MGTQDGSDPIWLKQTIQFSLGGQLRTIEMSLPIRPDASLEEIEQLLHQADVGLDQMTQHLMRKIDTLQEQVSLRPAPGVAQRPGLPAQPQQGAGTSVGRGQVSGQRTEGNSRTAQLPPSQEKAGDAQPAATTPALAPAEAPLDRKQFITEAAALGLNPRQAMERLGVRSLDGLHLGQALEQLRLQLLRERTPPLARGGSAPEGPSGLPTNQAGRTAHTAPLGAVRLSEEREGAPVALPPSLHASSPRSLSEQQAVPIDGGESSDTPVADRQTGRFDQPGAKVTPLPLHSATTLTALQERARAQALLARLRRLRGRLSVPGSDQVKAFRNVVESQLGAETTKQLLQAVWQVATPEKLNTDQLAECIRWGKDDQFAEEVELVLGLINSEES